MKRTRAQLQLAKSDDLRAAMIDVLSMAQHFGMTHQEIMGRLDTRVWQPAAKLPNYLRSELRGYYRARFDMFYRQDLEYRMLIDGVGWVNAHDIPAGSHQAAYALSQGGCHFWKAENSTLVKRPAKPFSRAVTEPIV